MALTSFWRERPTLVTGASGFVGRWLTAALVDAGATVVGIDVDGPPALRDERPLAVAQQLLGDVRDAALVEKALADHGIDTVFHLAAQTIVTESRQDPEATLDSNVRGTWTVLEACRRRPTVKRIVTASSDKAYGTHDELPYTEETPLVGRFPYDVSKAATDLIAQSYAATYDLPVAITRCANIYGGGDLHWSRLIPGTIRSALRGENPIVRSDGTLLRDYIYVEDAVAAYLLLAEALDGPEMHGSAFNFGQNLPLRVLDVVERIIALCGRTDLTPQIESRAEHEIPNQYLNSEKAGRVLGWKPTVEFDDGLARTVDWYRRYFETAPA